MRAQTLVCLDGGETHRMCGLPSAEPAASRLGVAAGNPSLDLTPIWVQDVTWVSCRVGGRSFTPRQLAEATSQNLSLIP